MWWFSTSAALLIGNSGSESTNMPINYWKKAASGIDQLYHTSDTTPTKTPLSSLRGRSAINSPSEKVSGLSLLLKVDFSPSSPPGASFEGFSSPAP